MNSQVARMTELRRRLGLTQEDVAQQLGVRVVTVNRWENERNLPRGLSRRALDVWIEQRGKEPDDARDK